ncbi:MAG: hypothetical protein E4G92_00955 [Bacteroidia bacterium]|nr:MAG: hypothetical protein E4G92_00955 [Bacteroidia bacterium]
MKKNSFAYVHSSYDKAVILPPYNNVVVQVVKRGDPPQIVTSGITVDYKIIGNTTSYGKREYGDFWDNTTGEWPHSYTWKNSNR